MLSNEKQSRTTPKVVNMAKEGEKDVKVEEDAAKAKNTFSEIYDYLVHNTYPSHDDKLYKHELRMCSKFFTADGGRLYYIGGKGSEKPRLMVERAEEKRRIIDSIHNQTHLGKARCQRSQPDTIA